MDDLYKKSELFKNIMISVFTKPEVHKFESGWEVSIIRDTRDPSRLEVGVLFKNDWTKPPIDIGIHFDDSGIANYLTRTEVNEIVEAVSKLE